MILSAGATIAVFEIALAAGVLRTRRRGCPAAARLGEDKAEQPSAR